MENLTCGYSIEFEKEGSLKEGSIVMFIDEGMYARWFYGHIGIVKSYTEKGSDGRSYCRVQWTNPIRYFKSFATISDFAADKFKVLS